MSRLNRRETKGTQINGSAYVRRVQREIGRSSDPDVRVRLQAKLDAHLEAATTKSAIVNALKESVREFAVCERLARIFKRMRDTKLRNLLRNFMEVLAQARTRIDCDLLKKLDNLCDSIVATAPA